MNKQQSIEFAERVIHLSKGDQTALKRSLGITLPNSSGQAQAAFFRVYFGNRLLPIENALFFAATAICFLGDNQLETMDSQVQLLPQSDLAVEPAQQMPQKSPPSISVAAALRHVKKVAGGDSLDKRLAAILDIRMDLQPEYLFAKLGRIIRMLKQKQCTLSFSTLVSDMTNWDHPDRFVPRQWAKDYYAPAKKQESLGNKR